MAKRIIVVGGSAAGPKAACKTKREDPRAHVIMLQQSPELSMSSCAYPYHIRDGFDRSLLIGFPSGTIRDEEYFRTVKGVEAHVNAQVMSIDRARHEIEVLFKERGERRRMGYDKLVLATGATPFMPPVPGIDLASVHSLWSMEDNDRIKRRIDEERPTAAVVIGGGLIGMEMVEALHAHGIKVTVVERAEHLFVFLDREMAAIVEQHVSRQGIEVITGNGLSEFEGHDGRVSAVKLADGRRLPCDFALVSVGVRPNSGLAQAAGLEIGRSGGVRVNEHLQTSDPDIYAAGDCTEQPHRVLGDLRHLPLGDLANLQGRVVGKNVVHGNVATYPGAFGTGACEVFGMSLGATGLWQEALEAQSAGQCPPFETAIAAHADKLGVMGGQTIFVKLIAARETGKILGMQAVGLGDAVKRVAITSAALHGGLTVGDLVNFDLPYAPPFSPAFDPLIVAAHVLENKLEGKMRGMSALAVQEHLESGAKPLLLDVRNPDEVAEERLGQGELAIPLGELRQRAGELPADRATPIITYCRVSLRGYEAAVILQALGYTRVTVMEGGLLAWTGPKITA